MSTTATLESPQVRLDAGGQAVVPLHIRNNGNLVEGYRFEIVGAPADWTVVEPPEVSLYPGTSTTATVNFRPPRTSTVHAGELPFGVRVVPTEHPRDTVVPEGVVEVLPFLETTAELVPRTSHGRGGAKHHLAVDNRGNVPVSVTFAPADEGGPLRISVNPEGMTVEPGNAAFTDVRVKPVKRHWRGAPLTHAFAVQVLPHAGPPVRLDGAHVQDPIFPKWLKKALALLIALLALLAALWFLVLKPTIKSAAKDAVKAPLAKAAQQAAAAKQQAAAAQQQAAAAQQQAGKPVIASSGALAPPAPAAVSTPFSDRLHVLTNKGATAQAAYTVPSKTTLNVTDLVFENPQGDFGTVTISQAGNTIMTMALENFRDTDYHFVSPIVVKAGQAVSVQVTCNAVGQPPDAPSAPTQCDTAVFVGGTSLKTS
jgi:hypothetical protein